VRKPEESFSQAIKRVVRKPVSAEEFFARINALGPMDDEFLEAVEQTRGDKGPSSFDPNLVQEIPNGRARHNRAGRSHVKRKKTGAKKAGNARVRAAA
jgi:hypothetical protein